MKQYYFLVLLAAFSACTSSSEESQQAKTDSITVKSDSLPVNDSSKAGSVVTTDSTLTKDSTTVTPSPEVKAETSTEKEKTSTTKVEKTDKATSNSSKGKSTSKVEVVKKEGYCPKCNKNDKVIPIKYGRPGLELQQLAKEGKAMLAGCAFEKGSPRHFCKRDNKKF